MTKVCNKCQIEKSTDEFHASKSRGLQAWCKVCRKEIDKTYWKQRSSNSEKMEIKNAYQKDRLASFQNLIYEYLTKNPCVDCGESDPIVLEFDHLVPENKYKSVSEMSCRSLTKVKLEISKCQVLCANCHRRKTAKQFGWYTYKVKTSGYS